VSSRPATTQPWIHSAAMDMAFILLPSIVATIIVLIARDRFHVGSTLSVAQWVVLVLVVDVAHVYSTLYRTYFDPEEFQSRRNLYIVVPIVAAVGGILLYGLGATVFWRTLAYLAVFHFVRQQYGFMMIYGRQERTGRWSCTLDKLAIYASTVYPLVFWHTHLPRHFNWFVEGDFFRLDSTRLCGVAGAVYGLIIASYIVKEIGHWHRTRWVNIPRNLVLLGTGVSWYVGIVFLNSDLAFTATNVIAHGIPYMALVWMYEQKKAKRNPGARWSLPISRLRFFSWRFVPVYVGAVVLLAYLEEGLWDGLVWREHLSVFPVFHDLPALNDHSALTWIVPILALPQSTHYLLDGFIWRLREKHTEWTTIAFGVATVRGEPAA
jgi:hypothetical protein